MTSFELDHTTFASHAFGSSLGTWTERPDYSANSPGRCEFSTDDHFDFPTADFMAEERVNDVISIGDSSIDECSPPRSSNGKIRATVFDITA